MKLSCRILIILRDVLVSVCNSERYSFILHVKFSPETVLIWSLQISASSPVWLFNKTLYFTASASPRLLYSD